jgi:glycosyltransferase involved in cell wall biosynthesis
MASALAQTYRDFELLVIGDCCTDDSEEVAQSFGDPRVQWRNLRVRYRSQSGPNNWALSIAEGELVAYLGHDDIWHPDHLQSLVHAIETAGAEMACSVAIMYGPPGSGIRQVTGIFVEGRWRRHDFAPPSSLMHRRELIDRIGPWAHPEQTAMPVDCELLRRAFQAGAQMAQTAKLTVFKFNSAWRRDSYLNRDTSEQREMAARLRAQPDRCVEEEWAALMRAKMEYLCPEVRIPEHFEDAPGSLHRKYLRMRGLDAPELCQLDATRRFSLKDQDGAFEWHGLESSPAAGTYRWSGPAPSASLILPIRVAIRFRVRLQILNHFRVDLAEEVTLRVAGHRAATVVEPVSEEIAQLESGVLEPLPEGPVRIEITVKRRRCPFFETDGAFPDTRWLGVCVNWVEVEPVSEAGEKSRDFSGTKELCYSEETDVIDSGT